MQGDSRQVAAIDVLHTSCLTHHRAMQLRELFGVLALQQSSKCFCCSVPRVMVLHWQQLQQPIAGSAHSKHACW
jgi:hypothetical protein